MDRLAEKAIGILNDCCEDAPETGCGVIDFDDYGQIMNALEKLRAYEDAEEQGQLVRLAAKPGGIERPWVSVNARLPEVNKNPRYEDNAYSIEVLAYIPADKEADEDELIVSAYYNFMTPEWREVTGGSLPNVTHWMPLPAPPTD